jgi:hypothetical protein
MSTWHDFVGRPPHDATTTRQGEGSIYRRASDGRQVAALIMEDGRRVARRASSRKDAAAKLELLLKPC